MVERTSEDGRSGTNDGKGAPGVSRRAVLLGFFALPIAAILEPEPALAQFGGLFGAVFGHRRYHHNSYHHQAHHGRRRGISRRSRHARAHVPHRRRAHGSGHYHHGGGVWRVERTGRRQLPLNQVLAGANSQEPYFEQGEAPLAAPVMISKASFAEA